MKRLICLLLCILFSACASPGKPEATTTPVPPSPTPIPVLAFLSLGDSYTIGQGVEPMERYPNQLAQRLRENGLTLVEPVILAKSGWTTASLLQAIDDYPPAGTYDLVTLLIGVNNQFHGQSIEKYREDFAALLDLAVGYAGGVPSRVIVLSIPDWGASPYAKGYDGTRVAAEIDLFNQVNLQETQDRGARYVDITPVSRQMAGRQDAFTADGLHPSGSQYSLWVEDVLPVALKALQDSD